MEVFNNTTKIVADDLAQRITPGSRISVAADCFSIYAYRELKKELEACEELRFIFTSPTFVAEKTAKERREFYISRLKHEKSIYGTEFEVRLRNELKQKAIAKEKFVSDVDRIFVEYSLTQGGAESSKGIHRQGNHASPCHLKEEGFRRQDNRGHSTPKQA